MCNLEYLILFVYVAVPATLVMIGICLIIRKSVDAGIKRKRARDKWMALDAYGHKALQHYVKDGQGNNLYPKHTPECDIWCGCSTCIRKWR